MPSIPQSLLWISLVVLWLFVLVPMLISKRDAVRRTSDVALATRVLNSRKGSRLLKRSGPAAGHRSDPHWLPEEAVDEDVEEDVEDLGRETPSRRVVLVAAIAETEPDILDVDIVDEDSGALTIGRNEPATEVIQTELELDLNIEDLVPESEREELLLTAVEEDPVEVEVEVEVEAMDRAELAAEAAEAGDVAFDQVDELDDVDDDGTADEYEYIDDSAGVETADESDAQVADSPSAVRRRRMEKTAAAVSARKYKFRRRMLVTMAVVAVGSTAAAFTVAPGTWWVCGSIGAVTLLYLAYLRRQTRIEERLRRRRLQRVARSRLGVENTNDRAFDVVPSRLRRPGSVVLEIDDEDPIFEHLDYGSMDAWDLPTAAGQ